MSVTVEKWHTFSYKWSCIAVKCFFEKCLGLGMLLLCQVFPSLVLSLTLSDLLSAGLQCKVLQLCTEFVIVVSFAR